MRNTDFSYGTEGWQASTYGAGACSPTGTISAGASFCNDKELQLVMSAQTTPGTYGYYTTQMSLKDKQDLVGQRV